MIPILQFAALVQARSPAAPVHWFVEAATEDATQIQHNKPDAKFQEFRAIIARKKATGLPIGLNLTLTFTLLFFRWLNYFHSTR
jgi:hypothetical protein